MSPYGCTWTDHAALNALAAGSVVFENAFAEAVDTVGAMSAILASFPAAGPQAGFEETDFVKELRENVILITDSPLMTASPEVTFRFDEIIVLPEPGTASTDGKPAIDIAGTHLASCFARIISLIDQMSLPATVIVHLTSMVRVWDAPVNMRERYREQGDPEPMLECLPPQRIISSDESRLEEILGIMHAIAAQVDVLDICLGTLFHELKTAGLYEDSIFLLTAPFAMAAGHHGVVGDAPGHLASDILDIPLFIKFPGSGKTDAWRDHGLIQPSMIFPLLISTMKSGITDWQKVLSREVPVVVRATSLDQIAVRTDAWLLAAVGGTPRLFAKPDDRWDVNPVEDRCRDVADGLLSLRTI